MTNQRCSFSAEFEREAAELVLKQNYSFMDASLHSVSASRPSAVGVIRFRRNAQASPRRAKRRYRNSRKSSSLKPGLPASNGKSRDFKLPPRRTATHWSRYFTNYTDPDGQWSLVFLRLSPRQKKLDLGEAADPLVVVRFVTPFRRGSDPSPCLAHPLTGGVHERVWLKRRGLPVIHDRAFGIDIGSRFLVVAVPADFAKGGRSNLQGFHCRSRASGQPIDPSLGKDMNVYIEGSGSDAQVVPQGG